jgi:hypothetical protein
MTTTSERGRIFSRRIQIGFYAIAVIFNLCLIAQVLTVGVAYFADPIWWEVHVWLVRE